VTSLRTDRLLLDTLSRDEARAIHDGDREGRRWALDYPTDGDAVVAAIVVEAGEHYDEDTPLGVLQIRFADSGEAIGGIGFLSAVDDDGAAEVGYGIAESHRDRGLASEALRAVCAHAAVVGVRRVDALTAADNLASQRVLQRCGFTRLAEIEVTDEGPMLRWQLSLEG
jgi:RimJ/RimL family protein N-acetyltransferase